MTGGCEPGCACDCCTGIEKKTPRPVANPAGRGALAYRVGTHPDFVASMLAHLGTVEVPTEEFAGSAGLAGSIVRGLTRPPGIPAERPLAALTARTGDDFALGLVDAWAAVLDVLTFYQERVANEGYLRTATELRSVRELARLVGYEPRPGVSASAYLAYEVDGTSPVTIALGSKAQSVPVAGQTPQTFETAADLLARDKWSNLVPRKARPQVFEPGQTSAGRRVWFTGLGTLLKPNDPLLLVFDAARGEPFRVKSVTPDNPAQTTRVVLQDFRTSAVLGDGPEAVKEAARSFERAVAAFQDAEVDRQADSAASGTATTDTPAPVKKAIDDTRTSLAALKVPNSGGLQTLIVAITLQKKVVSDLAASLDHPNDRRLVANLHNFVSRIEAVTERLAVQRVVVAVVELGGLSVAGYTPSAPFRDEFDALVARWIPAAVRTLSGLTLANLLYDTGKYVLDRTRVKTDEDFAKFLGHHNLTSGELEGLIRGVVRPVLTRFLRESQSGVLIDSDTSFRVARELVQLRRLANPPLVTKEQIDSARTLVEDKIKQVEPAAKNNLVEEVLDLARRVRAMIAAVAPVPPLPPVPLPYPSTPDVTALIAKAKLVTASTKALKAIVTDFDALEPVPEDATEEAIEFVREQLIGAAPAEDGGIAKRLKTDPLTFDLASDIVKKIGVNLDPGRSAHLEDAAFQSKAAFDARNGLKPQVAAFLKGPGELAAVIATSQLVQLLTDHDNSVTTTAALDAVLSGSPDGYQVTPPLDFRPDRVEFSIDAQVAYLKGLLAVLTPEVIIDGVKRKDLLKAIGTGKLHRQQVLEWHGEIKKVFTVLLPSVLDETTKLDVGEAAAAFRRAIEALPDSNPFGEGRRKIAAFLLTLCDPAPTAERQSRVRLWIARAVLNEAVKLEAIGDSFLNILGTAPFENLFRAVVAQSDHRPLLTQLNQALAALRQQQRLVEGGRYPRVGPWLDELLMVLDQIVSDLTIKADGVPSKSSTPDPLNSLRSAERGRAADLDPDIARRTSAADGVFSQPFADLAAQLGRSFDPVNGDLFYDALRNARFVRRERFQGVLALRARAAPFGHNAPLKTIFDKDGKPTGTEEWPIVGASVATIRVEFNHTTMTDFLLADVTAQVAMADGTFAHLKDPPPTPPTVVGPVIHADPATGPAVVRLTVERSMKDPGKVYDKNSNPATVLVLALSEKFKKSIRCEFTPQTAVLNVDGIRVQDKQPAEFRDSDEFFRFDYNQTGKVLTIEFRHGGPVSELVRNVLTLDAVYEKVTPGSFVVVERAAPRTGFKLDNPLVARVEAVEALTPTDYGLAGIKVSRLTLDRPWLDAADFTLADIRGVSVYLQSEPLELAGEPYDADIGPAFLDDPAAAEIALDVVYDGLPAGRRLIISGERTDTPGTSGVKAAELVTLGAASQVVDAAGTRGQGHPHTLLRLNDPLKYSYQRGTVTVHGNVVKADHGETKSEVLGSGDAATTNQRFVLKQKPLTYLPAPTTAGAADALKVRVNGVLWDRAERATDLTPADREFVLRTDPDGKAVVVFGDGTHGALVPTGTENVRAMYRVGLGKAGNLDAGAISQLVTRPLGVKGVTNPLASTGGADPESTDQARRNAPVGVASLGRLVSVSDYEDFARAFAGIAKSAAVLLSDGARRVVSLTVCGRDGDRIDPEGELYKNLVFALRKYGDPSAAVRVASRALQFLSIKAHLRIDPHYTFAAVEPVARTKLLTTFGFDRQDFARPLFMSDAVAALHAVPGVVAVKVTQFGLIAEMKGKQEAELQDLTDRLKKLETEEPKPRLNVRPARFAGDDIRPAEIAYLPAKPKELLTLTEWTS